MSRMAGCTPETPAGETVNCRVTPEQRAKLEALRAELARAFPGLRPSLGDALRCWIDSVPVESVLRPGLVALSGFGAR